MARSMCQINRNLCPYNCINKAILRKQLNIRDM
nr:MAG TPA: hypothetical protein [Caudoviricetes sp.]